MAGKEWNGKIWYWCSKRNSLYNETFSVKEVHYIAFAESYSMTVSDSLKAFADYLTLIVGTGHNSNVKCQDVLKHDNRWEYIILWVKQKQIGHFKRKVWKRSCIFLSERNRNLHRWSNNWENDNYTFRKHLEAETKNK